MKKISKILFIFLFVFLLGIINVNAATKNIELAGAKVLEKSSTITVDEPVISGNDITSNVTFNQVDDYVTFELTLKNNESEKYKITSIKDNNTSNNLSIEYDYSKDFISSGDTSKVKVKLTYKNKLTNQNLSLNNLTITLTVENEEGESSEVIINPNTGDNILHYLVLLIIALAGLILIKVKKKIKSGAALMIVALVLVPFVTFASSQYEINFKFTDVIINGEFETYNVTINLGDGSEPIVRPITYGESIGELPSAPQKDHETFSKWVDGNGNEVTSETPVTGPMTVTPVYVKETNNVTINLGDGSDPIVRTIEYGDPIGELPEAPAKDHETFSKWVDGNNTEVTSETPVTGPMTVTPVYVKETNSVTINLGDGSDPIVRTIEYGDPIGELPSAPVVEGHTFSKWVDGNGNEVTSETPVTGPMTISPEYTTDKHTLTIVHPEYIEEGDISGEYEYGTELTLTPKEIEGKTFSKWSDDTTDNPKTITIGTTDIEIEPIYVDDTPAGPTSATFDYGESVNMSMKRLAGNSPVYWSTADTKIKSVSKSDTAPDTSSFTEDNIISTDDSDVPIYAWWDDSTKTIYWYSEADTVYFNEDTSDFFSRLKSLTSIDISGIDSSNVTSMSYMFSNCESLTELDLTDFDTSNVINMSYIFNNCKSLQTLDISTWDTSNVQRLDGAFSHLDSMVTLDLSTMDTSNVDSFAFTFLDNRNLETLDISSWETDRVISVFAMFMYDEKLKTIYASEKFNVKEVDDASEMFYWCLELVGGKGTSYEEYGGSDNFVAHVDGGVSDPGYFTSKKYTVNFDPNGGSMAIESMSVEKGQKIGTLPTPVKDDSTFEGWYTDPENGDKVNSDIVPSDGDTYYAHWTTSETKLIHYSDNGDGMISSGDYVTLGGEEFWVVGTTPEGNVKLLAKYNLDENYRQSEDNYENIQFSDVVYWFSSGQDAATSSGTPQDPNPIELEYNSDIYGNFDIYRNNQDEDMPNNLNTYVDNYKNHLIDDLGINEIVDARIMTYSETRGIVCDINTCSTFANNQSYWLGTTGMNLSSIRFISKDYGVDESDYNSLGVRPLIVITPDSFDVKYTVSFDTDNGNGVDKIIFLDNAIDMNIGKLPEPVKHDSVFEGWYTDNSYSTKVNDFDEIDGDTTIYAKWTSCNGFADDSWETINNNIIGDESYYPVGCKKTIKITDPYDYNSEYIPNYTLRIANNTTPEECSSEGYSQSSCGVVIEFEDVFNQNVSHYGYEDTSYEDSPEREFLNTTFYDYFPGDLKAVIKETEIVTTNYKALENGLGANPLYEKYNELTTTDKIYYPSIKEVYGDNNDENLANEKSRQLDYYKGKDTSLSKPDEAKKHIIKGTTSSGLENGNSNWLLRNGIVDYGGGDYYYYYYFIGHDGTIHNYELTHFNSIYLNLSPMFRIGVSN